jgi:hypothetical protein
VSTRGDRFEQRMCTAVEAYFLFNIENDPLPKVVMVRVHSSA